ncbi:MAG: UvrD-helicase domain-containing protein [Chloroflexota bacterium]
MPLSDGRNEAQPEIVRTTTGPVAILAGAGMGKTRVVSERPLELWDGASPRPVRLR